MPDSIMYHSLQDLAKAQEEGVLDMTRTEDVWDSDVEILGGRACECTGRWMDALGFQATLNTFEKIISELWPIPATDSTPERLVRQMQPKAVHGDVAIMRAQAPGGAWLDIELPSELWRQEFQPKRRVVGTDEGKKLYSTVQVTKEFVKSGRMGFRNPPVCMRKDMKLDYVALAKGKLVETGFEFPPLCDEGSIQVLRRVAKRLVKLAEENGKRGDKYRLPILKVLAIDLDTGIVTNASSGTLSLEERRYSELANEKGEKDRFLDSIGEIPPYDGPALDDIVHPVYCDDLLYPMLEDSSGPVWREGSMDVGDKMHWVFTWGEVPFGSKRFLRGEELEDGTWTGPSHGEFMSATKEFLRQHEYGLAMNQFTSHRDDGSIPGRRLVLNPVLVGDGENPPAKPFRLERVKGGTIDAWVTAKGHIYARHEDVVTRERNPFAMYKVGYVWNEDWPTHAWLPDLLTMDRDHDRYQKGVEFLKCNQHKEPNPKRIQTMWVEYYIPLSILDPVYLDQMGLDRDKLANWKSSKGKKHSVLGVKVRVFGDHVWHVLKDRVPEKSGVRMPIVEMGSGKKGTYLPYKEDLSRFIKHELEDTPQEQSSTQVCWIPIGHPGWMPKPKRVDLKPTPSKVGDVRWKQWRIEHGFKD